MVKPPFGMDDVGVLSTIIGGGNTTIGGSLDVGDSCALIFQAVTWSLMMMA
jgi:hypothetical protein